MGTALKKAALAFAFFLLALWPVLSHSFEETSAQAPPSPPEVDGAAPAVDGLPAPVDKVLVLKSRRLLILLKGDETVRQYRIALGANPVGPKEQEGDERTPEGVYVLDWRNSDSKYYKSIHISYPSEDDVARAEARGASPGGYVMLHGLPEKMEWMGSLHRLFDWTDGCIAVTNAEMDEIWELVSDGTLIEIR